MSRCVRRCNQVYYSMCIMVADPLDVRSSRRPGLERIRLVSTLPLSLHQIQHDT